MDARTRRLKRWQTLLRKQCRRLAVGKTKHNPKFSAVYEELHIASAALLMAYAELLDEPPKDDQCSP